MTANERRELVERVARAVVAGMDRYAMVVVGRYSREPVHPEAIVTAALLEWDRLDPLGPLGPPLTCSQQRPGLLCGPDRAIGGSLSCLESGHHRDCYYRRHPMGDEALNSGDGTYRP